MGSFKSLWLLHILRKSQNVMSSYLIMNKASNYTETFQMLLLEKFQETAWSLSLSCKWRDWPSTFYDFQTRRMELAALSQKWNGNPHICKICFLFCFRFWRVKSPEWSNSNTAEKNPWDLFSGVHVSAEWCVCKPYWIIWLESAKKQRQPAVRKWDCAESICQQSN